FQGFVRLGRYALEPIHVSRLNDYILYSLWIFVLLPIVFLWWRFRCSDRRIQKLHTFVLLACLAAIGVTAVKAASGFLGMNAPESRKASIWESDRRVTPASWKPAPMPQKRDVYYLLFDRYGNEKTLQKFFGYDDSKFYDELEK